MAARKREARSGSTGLTGLGVGRGFSRKDGGGATGDGDAEFAAGCGAVGDWVAAGARAWRIVEASWKVTRPTKRTMTLARATRARRMRWSLRATSSTRNSIAPDCPGGARAAVTAL